MQIALYIIGALAALVLAYLFGALSSNYKKALMDIAAFQRDIATLMENNQKLRTDLDALKSAERGKRLTYAFLEEIENMQALAGRALLEIGYERERIERVLDIASSITSAWKDQGNGR